MYRCPVFPLSECSIGIGKGSATKLAAERKSGSSMRPIFNNEAALRFGSFGLYRKTMRG
jgi:hypothetical protein